MSLYLLPGNAATRAMGTAIDLSLSDFEGIARLVHRESIDMVISGPETPLVDGLMDYLQSAGAGKYLIGPHAQAAQLEGSKAYAKAFMERHRIPTAAYSVFSRGEVEKAQAFLHARSAPYVIKADGLAGGKGVSICPTRPAAEACLKDLLTEDKPGKAGEKVVVEEFLEGEELSFFVLVGPEDYLCLPSARDYKRAGDGDTGPNTGGMGAFSPGILKDRKATEKKIIDQVVRPTLHGLKAEGIHYQGFLFFGLMITAKGVPHVLEYNVRLGDPEAQAILPRIQTDLVDLLVRSCTGALSPCTLQVDKRKSMTLTMASSGYPGAYAVGKRITGLPIRHAKGLLFHAGTQKIAGQYHTSGGRVFMVTCLGDSLEATARDCYTMAAGLRWEGCYYRRDIGRDIVFEENEG